MVKETCAHFFTSLWPSGCLISAFLEKPLDHGFEYQDLIFHLTGVLEKIILGRFIADKVQVIWDTSQYV